MRLANPWLALLAGALGCSAPPEPPSPGPDIVVHGQWTLTVLEPDGRLVSTTEFHNELQDAGRVIPRVLVGDVAAGGWEIEVVDAVCKDVSETPVGCVLFENSGSTSPNHFDTLTVTPSLGEINLQGSFLAAVDGTIDTVSTRLGTCAPTTAPDSCTQTGGSALTQRTGLGIPIEAGQQGVLDVDITFGAAP